MQAQRCHAVIGFATIVGLVAGCQSNSPRLPAASGPRGMEVVKLPAPLPPVPAVDSVSSNAPTYIRNRLGPPPWPTNSKSQAWIPLEAWTDYNGFSKPRRISSSAQPSYEARTHEGVLVM